MHIVGIIEQKLVLFDCSGVEIHLVAKFEEILFNNPAGRYTWFSNNLMICTYDLLHITD